MKTIITSLAITVCACLHASAQSNQAQPVQGNGAASLLNNAQPARPCTDPRQNATGQAYDSTQTQNPIAADSAKPIPPAQNSDNLSANNAPPVAVTNRPQPYDQRNTANQSPNAAPNQTADQHEVYNNQATTPATAARPIQGDGAGNLSGNGEPSHDSNYKSQHPGERDNDAAAAQANSTQPVQAGGAENLPRDRELVRDNENGAPRDSSYVRENMNQSGKFEKARKVIGMEVKDQQDQKLGKVKDLAIDLHNGRILEVIVSAGGVLGMDEQLTAVPPTQFTCDPEHKVLRLNTTAAQFKSAPTFHMGNWQANVREENVSEVYQYYNAKPYFSATSNHVGDVQRAEKLLGCTVRNQQDQALGKIENLIVDLPAGRVVEVILASGGFIGIGNELSAVPPQSFHPGVRPDLILLDTSRAELTRNPHFKPNHWPDYNNYQNVEPVYRAYNVDPYFITNSTDSGARNVRERDPGLTPQDQGSSDADTQTTREIRKQVIAMKDLSVNAHNVKIITINGRVTLRGVVKTDDERREIADVAMKVAGSQVDNQLQVKTTTPVDANPNR